ncbi:MAG TPA: isochorismatase family protein [Phycisphaerales bacterium]|nr:isochorismatase family protein [Phycisphaerales bacterium]HMP36466.1 isochorismatase family protein [Phycisphaerales bacterium]
MIPRLAIDDTAVLVIDVQERLMPTIADRDRLARHCSILLRAANELAIPALVTEQYVRGLGRTVPEVSQSLANPAARIEKTRFSAAVGMVVGSFRSWRRSSVIVAGIEAHVCVLQTVLDLQAEGFQCFVMTDAISAAQRDQIAPALDRMRAAGAIPSGVLSAMYELMGDATHPAFKNCLELAKALDR